MMRKIGLLLTTLTVLATASQVPAEPPAAVRTDRYGDPLPPGALLRLGTVRLRQQGRSFAFSPDSKRIAWACSDGFVRIWDVPTGRELRRLDNIQYPTNIVYSPDGKLLAVSDFSNPNSNEACTVIHLWDLTTGKQGRKLSGRKPERPAERSSMAFSPDGKLLAVGEGEAGITLWNTATGDKVRRFDKCKAEFSTIVFLPDGKRLLVANREGVITLWDMHGRQLREFAIKLPISFAPSVTPDGKTLVLGASRSVPKQEWPAGLISVWDIATGKERHRMETPGAVVGIALSPDGKTVAYAQDGTNVIQVRDLESWKEKPRIEVPEGNARSLAFSPDSKVLAARVEHSLQLWDIATGKPLAQRPGHATAVDRVAFTANGRQLVSVSRNQKLGSARVWDALTGQYLYMLPDEWNWTDCGALCASRDGGLLLLGDTNTITIWDVAKRRRIRRIPLEKKLTEDSARVILALALSPDGRRMTSLHEIGDNKSVAFQAWEIASGAKLSRRTLNLSECLDGLPVFSPDGRILATTDGNTIWLRDGVSGAIRQTLHREKPSPREALSGRLVFSNDSRLLACVSSFGQGCCIVDVASAKGKVRVWEVATGAELPPLAAPWTQFIAFSPDGRVLATAGGVTKDRGTLERPIRLWDIATGEEVGCYEGHGTLVGSLFNAAASNPLAFSPDGQTLATGLMDSTILLWDVKPALQRVRKSLPAVREEDLPRLWADLASDDARKAQASLRSLAATPKIALPFLQQRLTPARAADVERLRRLIADLDSDQFTVRKAAYKDLRKLDLLAEPALRKTLEGKPSLESRRRIEELLAEMKGPITTSAIRQTVRSVAVLEHMDNDEARQFLKKLAAGAAEARLTREARAALDRLIQH